MAGIFLIVRKITANKPQNKLRIKKKFKFCIKKEMKRI